jgi:hypothetical protein
LRLDENRHVHEQLQQHTHAHTHTHTTESAHRVVSTHGGRRAGVAPG